MFMFVMVVVLLGVFVIIDLIPAFREYKKGKDIGKFPIRVVLLIILVFFILSDLFIIMDISAELPYLLD